MTGNAEREVVGLILYQQIGLCRGMRLMARHAVDLGVDLGDIGWVHHVRHRMAIDGMAASKFQRQYDCLIFLEVILWKFHRTIKNREHVLGFEFLWFWRVGTVTLQAQIIDLLGAQQMLVLSTVRLVASGTSLLKCGLMEVRFFCLISLVGMASQAGADGIRLEEARRLASMRIMASYALALSSGMLHLGLVDMLRLIAVAGDAESFRVSVGQNDFAVFRRRVAGVATLVGKRRMGKFLKQLRLCRLVGIMALRA